MCVVKRRTSCQYQRPSRVARDSQALYKGRHQDAAIGRLGLVCCVSIVGLHINYYSSFSPPAVYSVLADRTARSIGMNDVACMSVRPSVCDAAHCG